MADLARPGNKLFKKHVQSFVETLKTIIYREEFTLPALKVTALQTLAYLVETEPSFFKKNNQRLEALFEIYFDAIVQTAEEPTEEWLKPKEGILFIEFCYYIYI